MSNKKLRILDFEEIDKSFPIESEQEEENEKETMESLGEISILSDNFEILKKDTTAVDFKNVFKKEIEISEQNRKNFASMKTKNEHPQKTKQLKMFQNYKPFLKTSDCDPRFQLIEPQVKFTIWCSENTEILQKCVYLPEKIEELCNLESHKYFGLINNVISLLDSATFVLKVFEQIETYKNVKNKLTSKMDEQDPDLVDEFKFDYRFGESLKDLFQGFQFEFVCRVIFICVCLKRRDFELQFDSSETSVKILFHEKLENTNILCELKKTLQTTFGFDFLNIFECFILKTKTQSPSSKGEIILNKHNLTSIWTEEICYLLNKNILTEPIAFEITEEVFFFWILNNLVLENYLPLAYCTQKLTDSLINLYAGVLNVHKIKNRTADDELLYNLNWSSFILRKQEDDELGAFQAIFDEDLCEILAHKKLSCFKKNFEEILDFLNLLILAETPNCFQGELFQDKILIFLKSIDKIYLNQEIQLDLKSSITNNSLFFEQVILLWNRYNALQMNKNDTEILHNFLSDKKNIMLLKQLDNSFLVETFVKLNNLFLSKLERKNYNPSTYLIASELFGSDFSQSKPETFGFSNEQVFDSIHFNKLELLKLHLFFSAEVKTTFVEKLKNEQKILANVVCFANVEKFWEAMPAEIDRLILSTLNESVTEDNRFTVVKSNKANYLRLPKQTKCKVKNNRRFRPEYVFDNTNWDYLKDLIGQTHWKVQNGLFAWFSMFVVKFPYRNAVLSFFKKLRISEIKSRIIALRFFGLISKLFRLVEDSKHLVGFDQRFKGKEAISKIPPEVMVEIDMIFGYCETSKSENNVWDKEFADYLYEWLNKKTEETLFGINISKDFELALERVLSDLKPTKKLGNFKLSVIIVSVEQVFIEEIDSFVYDLFGSVSSNHPQFCISQKQNGSENFHTFQSYNDFCKNYLNFSAPGSTKKFKMKMAESQRFAEMQEVDPQRYNEIKNNKQMSLTDENEDFETSVSKTICFGYSGKELPRLFIDVFGDQYEPELSCFVKKEAKKLRCVINADLVSFAKQTYLHDWLKQSLSEVTKSKINSLLSTRNRLLELIRMQSTLNQEKWCMPIDLKDFHHHFGKSHFQSFGDLLLKKVKNCVEDPAIATDLTKILENLGDDLSKGTLVYSMYSEDGSLFGEQFKAKFENFKVERITVEKEGKVVGYKYQLKLVMKNGLMSGWKMTSLFGSLFNLTLNQLSQFFTITESSELSYNLNVLGDDTHAKRRYLSGVLNHTAFVNMIGKFAHPDKQLISSISSEFLKKRVDTVSNKVSFSVNRMWNSFLYSRDNIKTEMNMPDFVKLNVDVWNIFVSRIENPVLRKSVANQKYFIEFFFKMFKFKSEESKKNIGMILNSPTLVSRCSAGPLRTILIDFSPNELYEINIEKHLIKFEIQKQLEIFVLKAQPGQYLGVRAEVNGIMPVFGKEVKNGSHIRSRLIGKVVDEITESTAKYFDENTLFRPSQPKAKSVGELLTFIKVEKSEIPFVMFSKSNKHFDVEQFLDFSFLMIEENVCRGLNFHGLIGEVIYHTENVTKMIFEFLIQEKKEIQKTPNIWPLVKRVLEFRKESNFNARFLKKCFDKFGDEVFLKLATSLSFMVPVSQNYKIGEIVGYCNMMLSKSLVIFLIQSSHETPVEINEEFLKKILVTLDYYLNQNSVEITNRLVNAFEKKVQKMKN